MRVIVIGATSMLAKDLVPALRRAGHAVVSLPRRELDLLREEQILPALERALSVEPLPPTHERELAGEGEAVVNCAAYTKVDLAERERELAFAVNGDGPARLARAAEQLGVPLLHLSTDYVFSGRENGAVRERPYTESDRPEPINVYGQSKLAGEQAVLGASPQNTVVRSSWLFGQGGPNFVATVLGLAGERERLEVVDDQVGCPTWTGHLAPALVGLVERGVRGLVHLAGGGRTSWCGLAREVVRQAELSCAIEPITTAAAARPAPRPPFSAIESERGEVIPLPPWEDGLAGYLAARAGMIRP